MLLSEIDHLIRSDVSASGRTNSTSLYQFI
jgi:hypothetical protein